MNPHPFDLLMELQTHEIRLDCAALHLARDVYPILNTSRYMEILDTLAEEVAAHRAGLAAHLRYEAMQSVLVNAYGLTGNDDDDYDPDHCYLNRVLDTGQGNPIALSVIWIEVARRLKWPVSGVALPGHFVVRFDDPDRFVLASPFYDGRSLSLGDCQLLVEEAFEGELEFRSGQLEPVDTRAILVRMLANLRSVYLGRNDLPRVANILRRMAAVEPANGRHLQDLAAVCCRRGDVRGACEHLALYLHRQPNSRDSRIVRRNLKQLQAALVALN